MTTTIYRYRGANTFRPVNGGTDLVLGGGAPDPGDPPPEPPASWQDAVDSRDIVQVALWYEAHTGHDGVNPEDPLDLPLDEGDLTWIEDGIKSTHDGQVLEGLHANHIRIAHNNVTVRRCRVTDGTGVYGVYYNPTFGATFTGTVIEFCTVEGVGQDKAPFLIRPDETVERSALIQHNEIIGWFSGIKIRNNVEIRYNFVRDQYHPPGVHSTGTHIYGVGARSVRNFLTDGTSCSIATYFTDGWASDIVLREDIMGGTIQMPGNRVISPEASPSYAFTIKDNPGKPIPYGYKVVDCWLYGGFQYGLWAGGGIPWGEHDNERTGTRFLQTFTLQSGTSNETTYLEGDLAPFNS